MGVGFWGFRCYALGLGCGALGLGRESPGLGWAASHLGSWVGLVRRKKVLGPAAHTQALGTFPGHQKNIALTLPCAAALLALQKAAGREKIWVTLSCRAVVHLLSRRGLGTGITRIPVALGEKSVKNTGRDTAALAWALGSFPWERKNMAQLLLRHAALWAFPKACGREKNTAHAPPG